MAVFTCSTLFSVIFAHVGGDFELGRRTHSTLRSTERGNLGSLNERTRTWRSEPVGASLATEN